MSAPTNYDLVPYPSYTHAQTHPDRLAVIGRLFGLDAADVRHCRVLELGCGNGSNLVPMAWELPESEFVGVDLAHDPITVGTKMATDLGLPNVCLRQGDILEMGPDWGNFDYIIAHGLFSWVPSGVRSHLFRICQQCLSPHGVAFISYNALPGGHLRNMLREMMRFHVRGFEAPEERVQQAKAFIQFLTEAQNSRDEYRLWMKAELSRVLEHAEGHLYHDDLADVNDPLYFTQFIEQASRHGLQYLGEADYFEMSSHIFKPSVRQTLAKLGSNRILREQYLDFLKCRRFRQTLLCHAGVSLQAEPVADAIGDFWISSAAECQSGQANVCPGVTSLFTTPKGARVETDFALGIAALTELGPLWPMPLAFAELQAKSRDRLVKSSVPIKSEAEIRSALLGFLQSIYAAGVVEFRTHVPRLRKVPSERPMATPVARWQIKRGDFVTTGFHQSVRVEDEIGRCLLSHLDGTRDRAALAQEIWRLLQSKDAIAKLGRSEEDARHTIQKELENNLCKLARLGLLIA